MSSTIDIRNLVSDRQQRLISAIWAYFLQNSEWMPVRALHKEFGGKATARALIEELGGSIVFIPDQRHPEQYTLTLLGIFLSDQGEHYEQLLAEYLKFAYQKCYEEPSRDTIKSQEVAEALHLKSGEVILLRHLLSIGDSRFSSGGSFGPDQWESRIPTTIEDLTSDILAYIQQTVGANHDPQRPVEALKRHSYDLAKHDKEPSRSNSVGGAMPGIFISYSSKNRTAADKIAEYLRQRGAEVFVDYQQIRPGDSFPEQLQREIMTCDYFLLLISSQSINSIWVSAEVQLAFTLNKPIIPVRLELVDIALSPFWNLLHIEQVDFTHETEGALDRLALAIGITNTPSEPSDSADQITPPKHARLPFEPETVLIPAGSFLMGSTAEQFEAVRNKRYRELVEKHEPQQRTITLPEYQVGKYPVIVGEYRVFIEQGGYRERKWWTEAGWQQLKKDGWSEPRYWDSSIWTGDDHLPVVGVSWYEAAAYCQWLSETTGIPYRLPWEAEWEKAARGTDGRTYPWGNKWRKGVCNTREERDKRTLHTTPVGKLSPAGDSPNGVIDMSGNVQEWCVSKWSERYVYPEDIDLAGNTMRVQRGGSWLDYLPNARCAYRDGDYPDNRHDYRGFRVASAFPTSP